MSEWQRTSAPDSRRHSSAREVSSGRELSKKEAESEVKVLERPVWGRGWGLAAGWDIITLRRAHHTHTHIGTRKKRQPGQTGPRSLALGLSLSPSASQRRALRNAYDEDGASGRKKRVVRHARAPPTARASKVNCPDRPGGGPD